MAFLKFCGSDWRLPIMGSPNSWPRTCIIARVIPSQRPVIATSSCHSLSRSDSQPVICRPAVSDFDTSYTGVVQGVTRDGWHRDTESINPIYLTASIMLLLRRLKRKIMGRWRDRVSVGDGSNEKLSHSGQSMLQNVCLYNTPQAPHLHLPRKHNHLPHWHKGFASPGLLTQWLSSKSLHCWVSLLFLKHDT
jgi:hypothetical protein